MIERYAWAQVLGDRPSIRVNQLGYLPGHPMGATPVTDLAEPVPYVVRDSVGAAVRSGWTEPWPTRPEPTSGLSVHRLDFTGLDRIGAGFRRRRRAGQPPFSVDAELYRPLVTDALRVFTLLRSGAPVDGHRFPGYGRPAGHVGRPPNRGDRAVPAWTGPDGERLYPGWHCPGTFDVSGGWYDAGDYGKYVTSGAIAAWQLLSTVELLTDGSEWAQGLAGAIRDECRWQLEWLLRMQVPPGHPLAGMAFHRVHGTTWSPLPGLPSTSTGSPARPSSTWPDWVPTDPAATGGGRAYGGGRIGSSSWRTSPGDSRTGRRTDGAGARTGGC